MRMYFEKIKQPKYLLWLIARIWLGLICSVMGVFSLEKSGAINFLLWVILGVQFWIDSDMLKLITKVKRIYIVTVIFLAIIATT